MAIINVFLILSELDLIILKDNLEKILENTMIKL
jgi:hypothetical protein